MICVDENYVRQLAQTAVQWQKSGMKAPGSAISTALAAAPHAVDIPTGNVTLYLLLGFFVENPIQNQSINFF